MSKNNLKSITDLNSDLTDPSPPCITANAHVRTPRHHCDRASNPQFIATVVPFQARASHIQAHAPTSLPIRLRSRRVPRLTTRSLAKTAPLPIAARTPPLPFETLASGIQTSRASSAPSPCPEPPSSSNIAIAKILRLIILSFLRGFVFPSFYFFYDFLFKRYELI